MPSKSNTRTYKEIWDNLSKVDVSQHIKKKNGLSYLSWAWAWGVVMEHYPEAEYEFLPESYDRKGSCTVQCIVRIGECSRYMWLPVMSGYKNTAVIEPDARDIGDSRMRCLVKALAMFGLGHYIYAGEDLPRSGDESDTNVNQSRSSNKKAGEVKEFAKAASDVLSEFIKDVETVDQLRRFWTENKPALERMEKEEPAQYEEVLAMFKAKSKEVTGK